MKIYVGCALTLAPDAFKSSIDKLKNQLRTEHEVLNFAGLVKGTPQEAYEWDIHHCVAECDLFVAMCDYPAIGLGMELAAAVEVFHKPVLALAGVDAQVSRFLLGITAPGYSFERYHNANEIPNLVRTKISQLHD